MFRYLLRLLAAISLYIWFSSISSISLCQQNYTVIDLGTLGGNFSFAVSNNSSGQVVGNSFVPGGSYHAFLWENGVMTDLGTLGGANSTAFGINSSGQVVGRSDVPGGSIHAFLWENEVMTDLGTLGGANSGAFGINSSGQVVGAATLPGDTIVHPFLWENGVMTDLGTLGGTISQAFGINDLGQIVGQSTVAVTGNFRAFLWENGTMLDLGFADNFAVAEAINVVEQVVGFYADSFTSNNYHAFLWQGGTLTDLGTLGGTNSFAYDINESSQVVGHTSTLDGIIVPFHWENGVMTDLNSMIEPNSGWTLTGARSISDNGEIVGNGVHNGQTRAFLLTSGLTISSPLAGELWIAGEPDTIRWTGGQTGQFLDIDFTTDTATGSYETIIQSYPADSGHYVWNIPNNILSPKCKISIEDTSNPTNLAFSEVFKIKGYVLTRYNSNGNYDPYSKFRDPWTFANDSSSLWPRSWWERFDYSGTDPFTGYNYLLGSFGLFLTANRSDFPDWVSWVRTFGVNACYFRTSFPPIYSPSAVLKWTVNSDDWGGSCFGMSTSNALIFKNNAQFFTRYPTFPNNNPISISPTDTVKTVINELFTHQIGKEHLQFRSSVGLLKTPNETLRDIKKMLIDDNEPIRTLSITSNDPTDPGGHSILAFKVEQDTSLSNIFYVFVYDNAYPANLDSAIIIIDTLDNNGTGTWTPTYAWQNWGGNDWFYLRDPATNYLTNPTLPKQQLQNSPFIIDEAELQIYNTRAASILITDLQGNNSGYYKGVLINEIPDAFPNIIDNGSSGPPIGYNLSLADYSLTMNNYIDENSRISFFTGNKSFSYQRVDAQSTETDQLFFDGGVSYSNPDLIIKPINLISILNETIQEKAFAFKNVSMMQNDSVKLEYPDEDKIKLISYGSAKNYSLSIEFAKETGYGSFENDNISLSINTSHTIVPNWADIINSTLTILVDEGNNGTIDDTLYVDNTVEVEDQGSLLSPNSYDLAQNYPNPFNPVTTIQYSIPQRSKVTLKVYDILGNEVATLINEDRERGVYSVNFDASGLASGMYLYRLQAGSFVETKKMLMIK